MSSLKEKAKTAFEVWQHTIEEAHKNLPKEFSVRELSKKVDEIRKQKDWVKFEEVKKEIDKANYHNRMYGKVALERDALKKQLNELKPKLQQLQRWFEDLGRWIFSQRRDWSHPELPADLKERFEGLFKEVKEAK